MVATSSGTSMRTHNEAVVLRLIQKHHQLARTHLATLTGLTPAAIGRIVASLLQRKLIEEVGSQTADRPGRPVTLLKLAKHWVGLGVDVRVDRATLCALDVDKRPIFNSKIVLPERPTPAVFTEIVTAAIQNYASGTSLTIAGIGLTLPAVTDRQRTVRNSLYFGWGEVPIVDMVERNVGLPVGLCHVAEAAALAQAAQPETCDTQRLLHVQLGIGMGMAMAKGGGLDETLPIAWGGAGHVLLGDRRKQCLCGRYGCVDTMVGFPAFAELASMNCPIRWDGRPSSMDSFCRTMASSSDPGAEAAINTLADELARILAVFITIEAPEAVTLGGYPLLLGSNFKHRVESQLSEALQGPSPLVWTTLGDDAPSLGAALLGLAQLGRKPAALHQ